VTVGEAKGDLAGCQLRGRTCPLAEVGYDAYAVVMRFSLGPSPPDDAIAAWAVRRILLRRIVLTENRFGQHERLAGAIF